jgi:hypothetical protein
MNVDMKFSKVLFLFFLIVCSGCNSSPSKGSDDKACRQTIQNVYSTEFYCPNNLKALKSLYTDSFNQNFGPSLDRCKIIDSYTILKLLSSNDANYPKIPNSQIADGALTYYAEIEMSVFSEKSTPGNNPFTVWITMQMDNSSECKINDINGGG